MRVGIIAIQHESNTFVATPTRLTDFSRRVGDEIRREYEGGHHEIGGFFEGLADAKIDAAPIFTANATPAGTIEAVACDALVDQLLDELRKVDRLDGLLVAPHGAAVAANHRDMDGHWLSVLREKVGDIPIISTLDLHSNLSQKMIDACDATIAYRTNPHLDQRERGRQAATLMSRTLRKEIRPTQAAAFPRIAINIERQLTADSPCRELMTFADGQTDVLANSCVFGFPYADVEEMGSSFIAVTDNNPALARARAQELADYVVKNRQQFVPQLIDVEQAIDMAQRAETPVCLLDIGDNIGGGAPGNSTVIAEALHRRHVGKSFVALWDPAATQNVVVGSDLALPMLGKLRVISIHDGDFTEANPRHGGRKAYRMGRTAIAVSERGMTIMLTTLRTPPFSLNQLRSCNLDPRGFNILVAKGVHAPVAAYGEVCKTFIRVNTPGVTCADMTKQPYKYRRRPLFPFESIDAQ